MKRARTSATNVVDMGGVSIKRDSKGSDNTSRLSVTITDFRLIDTIGSAGEKCEEKWIISVFIGFHLSILLKFQFLISPRHKLRFS